MMNDKKLIELVDDEKGYKIVQTLRRDPSVEMIYIKKEEHLITCTEYFSEKENIIAKIKNTNFAISIINKILKPIKKNFEKDKDFEAKLEKGVKIGIISKPYPAMWIKINIKNKQ